MPVNQLFIDIKNLGRDGNNPTMLTTCVDFDSQLFSLNGLKIPFKDILHIARVIELEDPTIEDSDRVQNPPLRNG